MFYTIKTTKIRFYNQKTCNVKAVALTPHKPKQPNKTKSHESNYRTRL